jgi:hypothetical protein
MSDKLYFFQKNTGEWVFGPTTNSIISAGLLRLEVVSETAIIMRWVHNKDIAFRYAQLTYGNFYKENESAYTSLAEFLNATAGFFANYNPETSYSMFTNRLGSHGEITDLSSNFKLDPQLPFSICVVPKNATTDIILIVDLKLHQDNESSDFPIPLSDWTPGGIIEIPAEAIDLTDYYVYWACGMKAEREE